MKQTCILSFIMKIFWVSCIDLPWKILNCLLGSFIPIIIVKMYYPVRWRTMFGIAAVPSILLALGMGFSPESPRWLFQVFPLTFYGLLWRKYITRGENCICRDNCSKVAIANPSWHDTLYHVFNLQIQH